MLSTREEKNIYALLDSFDPPNIEIAIQIAQSNNFTINRQRYADLGILTAGAKWAYESKLQDLLEHLKLRTYLDLRYENVLDVQLPEQIYLLRNLRKIRISGAINQVRIPTSIAKLQKLSKVDINGSAINEIPEAIFDIPNLVHLGLKANLIKHISPKIAQLQKLSSLDLSYNIQLSDLADELFYLPNLNRLDIHHCPVKEMPLAFSKSKIKHLSINGYNRGSSYITWDDCHHCIGNKSPFSKAYKKAKYVLLENVPQKIVQHGGEHIKIYLRKKHQQRHNRLWKNY